MHRRRCSAVVHLALLVGFACSANTRVLSQGASEAAIKAGFLFNFAKFTEWPPESLAPSTVLKLCVTEGPVADALDSAVIGKSIGGHPAVLARVSMPKTGTNDALRDCAVLYVTGLDATRAATLIASLQGAAVLSVSDFGDFAALGGVANFFVEGERMRFAINPAAADRAHLHLHSQLLGLARLTKDKAR